MNIFLHKGMNCKIGRQDKESDHHGNSTKILSSDRESRWKMFKPQRLKLQTHTDK